MALQRVLAGYAKHPNVAAYILIGLGCEVNQAAVMVDKQRMAAPGHPERRPMVINIQEAGGIKKTVEKKLEPLFEGYQMINECGWLKKYYPGLFASPNLVTRIKLFSLENLINRVVDYQSGRWSERVMINVVKQINDFYKGDWLEKLLFQ